MLKNVSLPMYNLPEMQQVNQAFWSAIRQEAARDGGADFTPDVDFARKPVPDAIERETLFTQVCGYPLNTIFKGQAWLLGAPVYSVEQCVGATHVGVFVVHRDAPYGTLNDLKGCRFVYNSRHSNSGMNLPRRAIADIARGMRFFGSVVETHSQPSNIEHVANRTADATCVDCVTYAFARKYRSEMAERTRILAVTPRSPSIPFVTSIDAPVEYRERLANALFRVVRDPQWSRIRSGLMLTDIIPVTMEDYAVQLDYERQAQELGYPELL
jgi:ABC-type phosphate/phosphonate transport system substrate-binding protein